MRILNAESLISHGNIPGRRAMQAILEAGLQAADPYHNTLTLLRVEGSKLIAGNRLFEEHGDPRRGDEVIDLAEVQRIFVVGAGKGIARVALALEEVLGPRLTGGHIIIKYGDEAACRRIGVTYGAHPVPDEGCVLGCKRILELTHGLSERDLVFTVAGNGVSSLLTLPAPGVSLEDARQVTYLMQIERGAPTGDLNTIRNHLDLMKGGRISRHLQPARAIHIHTTAPYPYDWILHQNVWLHMFPEGSTYADAIANLKKWDAWDEAPPAVRRYLLQADPANETVKAAEFLRYRSRMFGIMPHEVGAVATAQKKAATLGFAPYMLADELRAEAAQVGRMSAAVGRTVERLGQPTPPPCALFSTGEVVVTVGKERGMGGRNQEWAAAAAIAIAGSQNVVMGAVDTDGTDGPGHQFSTQGDGVPVLSGGIVDGFTLEEARALGIDLADCLKRHDTSPALWKLGSGVQATQNISTGDLAVTLIMGRSHEAAYRR